MSSSDDPWEWWEILDIFTGMDERLARMESLLEKQISLMEGVDTGGGGGGSGITVDDVMGNTPITDFPITGSSFNQKESEGDVTIEPGSNEDVLTVSFDSGTAGLWYEVGTNDSEYSEYSYQTDGVSLLSQRLKEPLGLYNDTYRFPQPIIARDTMGVVVRRSDDAPSGGDYYSKIRYAPISSETADALVELWGMV